MFSASWFGAYGGSFTWARLKPCVKIAVDGQLGQKIMDRCLDVFRADPLLAGEIHGIPFGVVELVLRQVSKMIDALYDYA
jgi:hypothetical protein